MCVLLTMADTRDVAFVSIRGHLRAELQLGAGEHADSHGSVYYFVPRDLAHPDDPQPMRVNLAAASSVVGGVPFALRVASDASDTTCVMGIDVYSSTLNDEQRACGIHAGAGSVTLAQLRDAGSTPLRVPLVIAQADRLYKGCVVLSRVVLVASEERRHIGARVAHDAPGDMGGRFVAHERACERELVDALRPYPEALAFLRAPMWNSGNAAMRDMPAMPPEAFWMRALGGLGDPQATAAAIGADAPADMVSYYGHVLNLMLTRYEMDEQTFVDTVEAHLLPDAPFRDNTARIDALLNAYTIVVAFLCEWAVATPYIGDFVVLRDGTRAPFELFDQARARRALDCEDGASDVALVSTHIERFTWPRHAGLRAARLLLQHVLPGGELGVVTAARAGGDSSNTRNLGGHMWHLLLNVFTASDMLARGRALIKGAGGDDALFGRALSANDLVAQQVARAPTCLRHLPSVLICEATGRVYPLPGPLSVYAHDETMRKRLETHEHIDSVAERYVAFHHGAALERFGAASVIYPNAPADTEFYRYAFEFSTTRFVGEARSRVVRFVFADTTRRTYGAPWEWLCGSEEQCNKVALVPRPPMSREVLRDVYTCLGNICPDPRLHAPTAEQERTLQARIIAPLRHAGTASAARVTVVGRGKSSRDTHTPLLPADESISVVTWYVPIDAIQGREAELADVLANAMHTDSVLVRIRPTLELITRDRGVVRLDFMLRVKHQ